MKENIGLRELNNARDYKRYTLIVDGSRWNPNETEKTLFRRLYETEDYNLEHEAIEIMTKWLDANEIKWDTMSNVTAMRYDYGEDGQGHKGGHFIIDAFVELHDNAAA